MTTYELSVIPERLSICRLDASAAIPAWATRGAFFSVVRTRGELSIVCATIDVPADVVAKDDWRALEVRGPLDFALTGVLSRLLESLASAAISIFAVSTYDTDYVLVAAEKLAAAVAALRAHGHRVS